LQLSTTEYRILNGQQIYVVPTGPALEHFYAATKGGVAPNMFLVDAPDASSAIEKSSNVFAGDRSADIPVSVNQRNPARGSHWLVVFLGIAGSDPIRWYVDSVSVHHRQVRFNYHRNPMEDSSSDLHYYLYWVPLGTLEQGIYQLELCDVGVQAITVTRRVVIKKKSE